MHLRRRVRQCGKFLTVRLSLLWLHQSNTEITRGSYNIGDAFQSFKTQGLFTEGSMVLSRTEYVSVSYQFALHLASFLFVTVSHFILLRFNLLLEYKCGIIIVLGMGRLDNIVPFKFNQVV